MYQLIYTQKFTIIWSTYCDIYMTFTRIDNFSMWRKSNIRTRKDNTDEHLDKKRWHKLSPTHMDKGWH